MMVSVTRRYTPGSATAAAAHAAALRQHSSAALDARVSQQASPSIASRALVLVSSPRFMRRERGPVPRPGRSTVCMTPRSWQLTTTYVDRAGTAPGHQMYHYLTASTTMTKHGQ